MITDKSTAKQLPSSFQIAFAGVHIGKQLRQAGISKALGFSCLSLFQTLLLLVFQHKNGYRMMESRDSASLPAKDAVYHFLNCPRFSWRKFLLSQSASIVLKIKLIFDRPLDPARDCRGYFALHAKSPNLVGAFKSEFGLNEGAG